MQHVVPSNVARRCAEMLPAFGQALRVCYLIVIAAVSLATFVASLMVFLLESALQEGVSLH